MKVVIKPFQSSSPSLPPPRLTLNYFCSTSIAIMIIVIIASVRREMVERWKWVLVIRPLLHHHSSPPNTVIAQPSYFS